MLQYRMENKVFYFILFFLFYLIYLGTSAPGFLYESSMYGYRWLRNFCIFYVWAEYAKKLQPHEPITLTFLLKFVTARAE